MLPVTFVGFDVADLKIGDSHMDGGCLVKGLDVANPKSSKSHNESGCPAHDLCNCHFFDVADLTPWGREKTTRTTWREGEDLNDLKKSNSELLRDSGTFMSAMLTQTGTAVSILLVAVALFCAALLVRLARVTFCMQSRSWQR